MNTSLSEAFESELRRVDEHLVLYRSSLHDEEDAEAAEGLRVRVRMLEKRCRQVGQRRSSENSVWGLLWGL